MNGTGRRLRRRQRRVRVRPQRAFATGIDMTAAKLDRARTMTRDPIYPVAVLSTDRP